MRSEIVGTVALWLALTAAILTSFAYSNARERLKAAVVPYLIVLALQCLHFFEEFETGFQSRFPERLGLAPWPDAFFVGFNAIWLCIWSLAAAAVVSARAPRTAGIAVWFLTYSAIGNAVAHPVLALAAGGYFPGLVTAPLLGVAGLFLWRSLARSARNVQVAG